MKYSINLTTGAITMSVESLRQLIYRVGTAKEKLEEQDWDKIHNPDGSIRNYTPIH